MAVTPETLREYLRDPPESDDVLNGYLAAAKSKARAAGITEYKSNAQYDLFLKKLTAMEYGNRGMGFSNDNSNAAEAAAQRLINSFVLSLRYAGEDEPDDENDGG